MWSFPLRFLLRAQAHPKLIYPSTPPSIHPSIQELWFSSRLHIPFGFMENTPRLSQARLSFAHICLLLLCTGCRRTLETCCSPCLPWKVGWFSALRFPSLSFPPWKDGVCVCVCTRVLGKGARDPFSDLLQHLCFFASLELVALAAVTKKSPNLSCLPW